MADVDLDAFLGSLRKIIADTDAAAASVDRGVEEERSLARTARRELGRRELGRRELGRPAPALDDDEPASGYGSLDEAEIDRVDRLVDEEVVEARPRSLGIARDLAQAERLFARLDADLADDGRRRRWLAHETVVEACAAARIDGAKIDADLLLRFEVDGGMGRDDVGPLRLASRLRRLTRFVVERQQRAGGRAAGAAVEADTIADLLWVASSLAKGDDGAPPDELARPSPALRGLADDLWLELQSVDPEGGMLSVADAMWLSFRHLRDLSVARALLPVYGAAYCGHRHAPLLASGGLADLGNGLALALSGEDLATWRRQFLLGARLAGLKAVERLGTRERVHSRAIRVIARNTRRGRPSALPRAVDFAFERIAFSGEELAASVGRSAYRGREAAKELVALGLVQEISARERFRIYAVPELLD